MKKLGIVAAGIGLLLGGCASLITGQSQPLSVETLVNGEPVKNVSCKLANDKGEWFVKTPGSVTVTRSVSDLRIACYKEGIEPGFASVESNTKAAAATNLVTAGTGLLVDVGTGAAFDYPYQITVEMGEPVLVPLPAQDGRSDTPNESHLRK